MAVAIAPTTYTIGTWAANVTDDYSCQWGVNPGSSITDGPGVKLHQTDRPYGIGSFRTTSFRDKRLITIQGYVQAPNRAALVAARSGFLALFASGVQQTLVVNDGISPKQITVELADVPKFTIAGDGTGADWQLQMSATDPRFYDTVTQTASTTLPTAGAVGLDWATGGGLDWSTGGGLNWGTIASSGTIALTNTGNADSWPTFSMTGPLTNPVITCANTAQQLIYNGSLVSGDTLVITTNPTSRSVLLNGSDRFTLMPTASWFSIGPANSITVSFIASAGSGTLTASWQNASW